MIRSAIRYVTAPNEKMVLNMLNWDAECATCGKVLVGEIRRLLKEVQNETSL